MRLPSSQVAGRYSSSVGTADQASPSPAPESLPDLFLIVDRGGRIVDSLINDGSLLEAQGEKINGRRIQRVLFVETVGQISEAFRLTSDSRLILDAEYDQETTSGRFRLRAQFIRLHSDRLLVRITKLKALPRGRARVRREEPAVSADYSEIFRDREFVRLVTESCQICCNQFGAKSAWFGLPVSPGNAIWLNGQSETYSPVEFGASRVEAVLQNRTEHIGGSIDGGWMISDGLFPLISSDRVLGLLGIIGGRADFFQNERLEQMRHFAQLMSSSLSYIFALSASQPRLEQIQALREIDQAILSSLNLRQTANVILATALHQLSVDAADILILNRHTQTLDYVLGLGFRSNTLQHTHLKLGESYAGIAALENRVVHIRDLKRNSRNFAKAFQFESESFYTYLGVPLIARGEVQGVLEVFRRSTAEMEPGRLKLLEMIAAQIAIAMDNSALVESLDRRDQDISSANNATIEGLSRALELRDRETEGHAHRVADLSTKLAMRLGISGEELERARQGALLHDIGKIGIPDKILRKPGKLNAQEWSIMKQHPLYAYNVLSQIDYLRPALAIPLHHHERWDGNGYPHGLHGESIPLAARVFAVIDVFDALTSDRPYRPAWTKEQAISHIIAEAGRQFDPRVVEEFTTMIAEP
jgi:HD-GYP domain-containing protein (c-di-GMP phosphodiesterase class II)